MDKSKRGGVWESFCLLFLFLYCLTCQHFQCVDSVPEEDYAMLLENQGFNDAAADSRSRLESSLNHLLEQDAEDKRSSSFFPLRGKKMTSSSDSNNPDDTYQYMSDPDDKRSQFYPLRGKKIPSELKRASYFMPMRGRKNDDWNGAEEEGEEDMDKRASSFMPMRGKKKYNMVPDTFQHYGKSGTYPNIKTDISFASSSDSNRVSDKRMSSFIPVRGRKSVLEETQTRHSDVNSNNSLNETQTGRSKRSISFTPMRGRRLLSHIVDQEQVDDISSPNNALSSYLEKKYYSFMPMRGRKANFGESKENLPFIFNSNVDNFRIETQENDESPDAIMRENASDEKRASAFMPMRGKKDVLHKELYDPEEKTLVDKKLSSFMPMRGRRGSVQNSNMDFPSSDVAEMTDTKRARASSFMPMRGRRETDDDKSSLYENSPFKNMKDEIDFISNASLKNFSDDLLKRLFYMPTRYHRIPNTADSNRTEKKFFGFMPMRGRRFDDFNDIDLNDPQDSKKAYAFMRMRGRRSSSKNDPASNSYYSPFPYFIPAGIGSALISRPFGGSDMFLGSIRDAAIKNRRVYDWDSVKRAFHASRGKRTNDISANTENYIQTEDLSEDRIMPDTDLAKSFRFKRNTFLPQVSFKPQRTYLALKRPMSFFATRGKRMDRSTISKLP